MSIEKKLKATNPNSIIMTFSLKMKNFTKIKVLKLAIDADSFFIFNLNNHHRGGQNM